MLLVIFTDILKKHQQGDCLESLRRHAMVTLRCNMAVVHKSKQHKHHEQTAPLERGNPVPRAVACAAAITSMSKRC
jgi:hypothetical protein